MKKTITFIKIHINKKEIPHYVPFQKVIFSDINSFGSDNRTPLKTEGKIMEEHKLTKQDKLAYTITLAVIFFGVFGLGLIGLIINIFS